MITTAQLENSINRIVDTVANEYPGIERCWLKYCADALLMYKILSAKIKQDDTYPCNRIPNQEIIDDITTRHGFYIPPAALYDALLFKCSMATLHKDKLLNTLNKLFVAIEKTTNHKSKPVISTGLRKFMPRFGKMTAVKKSNLMFKLMEQLNMLSIPLDKESVTTVLAILSYSM